MKKKLCSMLIAILAIGALSACSLSKEKPADTGNKQIVTTIFPEYDWVMNILGDNPGNIDVTMLLDNGVDLHSYQPTADDIMKISTCDLFVYVGGESDAWVADALKEAVNKDMIVINLLDVLGDSVKEEEVVEGMQAEEEEEEEEGDDEEVEYDEHVWLSLKDAAALTDDISRSVQKIDPANADTYRQNTESYIGKLNELDASYNTVVSAADKKVLLFGDRFPFRYMTDDYGLDYYAAFVGCSAETEASFETITFLSGKVDELGLNAVMTIEGTDHRIAETIVANTGTKDQKILTLDSMQSVTSKDVQAGKSYLSIMENNLSVLKEALDSGTVNTSAADDTLDGAPDVDLTTLSSTMVYAEVYDMMVTPEKYIGKTVKMNGTYNLYHDDTTDKNYFACIIADATACCSQGIEFILTDAYSYPDDYPPNGAPICVAGVFDTYKEGDRTYCTLREANLLQ